MKSDLSTFAVALAARPLLVSKKRLAKCRRSLRYTRRSLASACELIMLDPGLCMLVLRHVNRIRSRSGNPLEISSVVSAVNLLGENAMLDLIDNTPILEQNIADEKIRVDYYQLLDRSFHAAHFSKNMAIFRNDAVPDECGIAGLLRDIGEIALCTHHYDLYKKIRSCAISQQVSMSYAAEKVLGFNLTQLSGLLAEHWFLPEVVRDAMDTENYSRYRAQGVMLASECARLVEFGWYHRDMVTCQTVIADYLNTGFDRVCSDLHQSTVAIARGGNLHNSSMFAAQLVQLPHEARESIVDVKSSRPAPVAGSVTIANNQRASPKKKSRSEIYTQCIEQIKMRAASGGANVNELVKTMLYGLHKGVGMRRVAFATLDESEKILQIKMSRGIDAALANSIVFSCAGKTLFSSLMKRPQAIWINTGNIARYSTLIPEEFSRQVDTDEFICISLFCANRPLGLVYCDRAGSDKNISEGTLRNAKSLVSFTGKAIAFVDSKRRALKKMRALSRDVSAVAVGKNQATSAPAESTLLKARPGK